MHTNRSLIILTLICVVLAPFLGRAMLRSDVRGEREEEFFSVLDTAETTFKERSTLNALERKHRKAIADTEKKLAELARRKRTTRLELASVRLMLQKVNNRADMLLLEQGRIEKVFSAQQDQFSDFLREAYVRQLTRLFSGAEDARFLFRRLAGTTLGEDVDEDVREEALVNARQQLISTLEETHEKSQVIIAHLHEAAGELSDRFFVLKKDYDATLREYLDTQKSLERAKGLFVLNEAQLQEVKREMAQVHADVLRLQAELTRIDVQLKRKAERALIEKGLRAPRLGLHSNTGSLTGPKFTWPVRGPITAGFRSDRYRKIFGVPHDAIDIARPQGSLVSSAADGIVFLVRDGGDRGYTYVLIGHEDGFATLYGHLLSVVVNAGQEVKQGQVIGLSGGEPGTPGSGPMTTGQHLHFEVIQQGANINPLSVLP